MQKTCRVEFATAAEHGVIALEQYLIQQCGARKAGPFVDQLVMQIISTLSEQAHTYAVCQQAASLGVTHFHEFLPMGQRVLYEIYPAENLVVVALVIGQRQSVEKQLIDYCLQL
ncbi:MULTISPECIES: hypothetical protein [Pseudomonas]|jgi:hypothetical protein|uniref:Type II toxin-antitoxin system RelE/ParE family toxin n=1 Tax=Pseudomonas chlororaphis subsp. aureofaciens TaxID=587851 RepID=A0AAD0ZHE4_9PSED|nr:MULTISPECIES: hypothetical protein [Pseudomonas]AIC21709.1 hypothetical protein EY04_23175 [Pseudomonas chlororaphis]AZE12953.1 hypothetical protein C4K10_4695 [Pseudomonas chlororaphis subsp. aureofaciens]AZE18920.1 hypothetical protein C4K09_4481 [Pseudomonas chlororaphis subsp. aureofaciens]AZE25247.1 hypothetical protein C4K08_4842 [Pseudomonas chlororaphis subsp. aureofaciens]AZE31447.1 hypothetical protein C4K07_4684 [Pseudomonas chlororaphis subsp. aureofaciens]